MSLLLLLSEDVAGACTPQPRNPLASYLLMETGDRVLQETCFGILLEQQPVPTVTPGGIIRMRHWPSTPVEWWDDEEVLIVSES